MAVTGRKFEEEDNYPVVHTANNRHKPEWVVKHDWGVVMGFAGYKRSLPWHMVESVREEIVE